MKKLIASILTVATVASMASMSAFAASTAGTKASFTATLAAAKIEHDANVIAGAEAEMTVIPVAGGATLTLNATFPDEASGADDITAVEIAEELAKDDPTGWDVVADGAKLTFTQTTAKTVTLDSTATFTVNAEATTGTATDDSSVKIGGVVNGVTATGAFASKVLIEDAILSDVNGNPIALVESGDSNDSDGVKSGKSVYFMVKAPFTDDDYFKVEVKKADGSKNISKISTVDKNFSSELVKAGTKDAVTGTTGRKTFVKVELKEDYSDSEYKINFDMTIKCKKDYSGKTDGYVFNSGSDLKLKNVGQVYMKNSKDTADDVTYSAGTKGVVVKPIKNEENTVEWEDNNDTIAKLTFEADSDVNAYYPKLSTKWDNADYAENFADTDAFIRSFVGNPTISSTSRPVLEFFNPFVNEDDEETVAAEDVVIYEVVDGALVDVTEKFTIGDNDDGDSVFSIKTRTLGTYIFSNGAAVATEEAPAEEVPSDVKENPGTGRF